MLLDFVVEEWTEDTASHVAAAVAADEDCGFDDWDRRGEVWWRIKDGVWAQGLVAEVGGCEVGSVGGGAVDVWEVQKMRKEFEGRGRFRRRI